MIYVTLGTMFLDFGRLVKKMDEVAEKTGEQVIMQTGLCDVLPRHCERFDFKGHEEVLELQRNARVIVCHAGIGAVMDALAAGRPLVVVPRRKCFGEHLNDHQLELARAVEARGWGRMIMEIEQLEDACAHPPAAPKGYTPAREPLIAAVRRMVDQVAAGKAAGCG